MSVALSVMMILALVFGGSAGVVAEARESLPGSPLYGLKVRVERWDIEQVATKEELANRALEQAQERVKEATQLSGEGKTVPDDVALRFREQLSIALQAGGSLEESHRLQFQPRLREALQQQLRTMTQLAAQTKGEDGDNEAVAAMVRTIEQTQAQLALRQGRIDHSGTGLANQNRTGDSGCDGADECIGAGTGPNEDASGWGPGDGSGDGVPDRDGDGYGPGTLHEDTPGYGPGDGTGDGEPDQDGDGYGPGMPPEETPGYGPGDGTGDGDPDQDGDGNGPGAPPADNAPGDGPGDGGTGDGSGSPNDGAPGDDTGGESGGGDNGAGGGNH